ncbi:helix-turn-helix domain-containing protein [Siphonobacter aquaeclarae]|uniref:Helix-turn-helix n=1 Tax=Siphonobacter aquaeclarae TaxID=563176 RepID=A0A1G9RNZ8_9BACT|nr:helix-turn-helix transcriptional regulator [Siphonobacter aquaeclarae]SDM24780.1 Helix-turn-helix [Siphonobacter aquaeclarae]
MSDKEKVLHLLESKNLTAAQFADAIGIPRSSISHILSERNRLSMDITRKIVKHYPEVTFEWLCDENPAAPVQAAKNQPQPAYSQSFRSEFPSNSRPPESPRKNGAAPKVDWLHSRGEETAHQEGKHVVKMIVFYSDQTWAEII